MQNFAPGGAGVPQLGHVRSSAFPHDMQNFAEAGFSVPQTVQVWDAITSRYGMPEPFNRAFGTVRRPARAGPGRYAPTESRSSRMRPAIDTDNSTVTITTSQAGPVPPFPVSRASGDSTPGSA
jgi:hypothetical protein